MKPSPTHSPREPASAWITVSAVLGAAAVWLWVCWCLFPIRGWNDVRLAPVFGLKLGLPLYPGATGPASTWMYGPLPLLLLWPATWASDALHALLVAGGINLGISLGAIGLVCALWPAAGTGAVNRLLAFALCVVILPASMWQYLQADNDAVALGLLANLVLVLSPRSAGRWGAALLATAGLLCKQTSVGVPLAQLIWLAATEGRMSARDHALRLLASGAAWAMLFLLLSREPRAIWFNLVLTPGALPWISEPWGRLWDMSPWLAVDIGVPIAAWLWLQRTASRRALALPMLAWLCAWLPGFPALLKIGGTINNLQSFTLWLPPALVIVLAAVEQRAGFRPVRLAAAGFAILLCTWRIALLPVPPWRPPGQLYREAGELARARPGRIWFPWHPLVTVFSEQRLYSVEDGLYVRFLSGRPLTLADARAHLPPGMSAIALPRTSTNFGVALSLRPPEATRNDIGLWTVYSWPAPSTRP